MARGTQFAKTLTGLTAKGGEVIVARTDARQVPLGLHAGIGEGGALRVQVVRPEGTAWAVTVTALSAKGEKLAKTALTLAPDATRAASAFDLPLEIRNQVARLEIADEPSAGAVQLLDRRSQWRRIGVISGESREFAPAPAFSALLCGARTRTLCGDCRDPGQQRQFGGP